MGAISIVLHQLYHRQSARGILVAWYLVFVGLIGAFYYTGRPKAADLATCATIPFLSTGEQRVSQLLSDEQAFLAEVDEAMFTIVPRPNSVRDRAAEPTASRAEQTAAAKKSTEKAGEAGSALQQTVQSADFLFEQRLKEYESFVRQRRREALTMHAAEDRTAFLTRLRIEIAERSALEAAWYPMRGIETNSSTHRQRPKLITDYYIDATNDDAVRYVERIKVESAGRITNVDLRELNIATTILEHTDRFAVSYGGGQPQPLHTLSFAPLHQDFTVYHEISVPAAAEAVCGRHRWSPTHEFVLRWPRLLPAAVYATIESAGSDHEFQLHPNRTVGIAEVRVSPHSFYTSDYPLAVKDEPAFQSLMPTDSDFTPTALGRINAIKVQVLPNHWPLRSRFIQEKRHYLIATNLPIFIVIQFITTLFGLAWLPVEIDWTAGKPTVKEKTKSREQTAYGTR
jgi:hypothetical protein